MQEEVLPPLEDVQVTAQEAVQVDLANMVRALLDKLDEVNKDLKIVADMRVSEQSGGSAQLCPYALLYQSLQHLKDAFFKAMDNMAVSLLIEAKEAGRDTEIAEFARMFAELNIVGRTSICDQDLSSSAYFRGYEVTDTIETCSQKLLRLVGNGNRGTIDKELKSILNSLPDEQRLKLYTCLRHLIKDNGSIVDASLQHCAQEGSIQKACAELALAKKQMEESLDKNIKPIVNRLSKNISDFDDVLGQLEAYFLGYIGSYEFDSDRNLAHEILAFFQLIQKKMNRSIAEEIAHNLQEISQCCQRVENVIRNASSWIETTIKHLASQEAAASSMAYESHVDDASRDGLSSRRITPSVLGGLKRVCSIALTLVKSISPTYTPVYQLPQTMYNLEREITELISSLTKTSRKIHAAALGGQDVVEHLRIFSKIFYVDDSEGAPRTGRGPSFYIPHQDEVERSMAQDTLLSQLRTYAARSLLQHILKISTAEDGMPLIPTIGLTSIIGSMFIEHKSHTNSPEKLQSQTSHTHGIIDAVRRLSQPHAGLLRPIGRAIEKYVPEVSSIVDDLHKSGGCEQQEVAQDFDTRYTQAIIQTQNPRYILYDIAARTRFNTGRFSYLIRPMVHKIEEVIGGPLETDNYERPGDRYHDFMEILADETTPLEHPWLLLWPPTRLAVKMIEGVLRVANHDGQGFPEARQSEPAKQQDQLKSTSFRNLVWNVTRKFSEHKVGSVVAWFKDSCMAWVDGIQQCARFAYTPFKKPLKRGFENLGTGLRTINGYLSRYTRLSRIAKRLREKMCAYAPRTVARNTALLIRQALPTKLVKTLEDHMRKGRPVSTELSLLMDFIRNNHLGEFTDTVGAAISHNSRSIRNFAAKYLDMQSPVPITKDVIRDDRLRSDLETFAVCFRLRRQQQDRTEEQLRDALFNELDSLQSRLRHVSD
jgi:hypothetical protein